MLSSVNKLCIVTTISRDTVIQACTELKKRGVLYATLGKGYYIKNTKATIKQKVFLLFDELTIFKEDFYPKCLIKL